MEVIATIFPEVKLIKPQVFGDSRGYFFESYQKRRYDEIGIELDFVQDNFSRSSKGVLRGLHYQLEHPQGKLVTIARGRVYDVAVDVRQGSPTFSQWYGEILSDENHLQLYIPPGFAHGFYVLSETADFCYKCTNYYHPGDEHGVIWNDKTVGIKWPLEGDPLLSKKDEDYKEINTIDFSLLPKYKSSI